MTKITKTLLNGPYDKSLADAKRELNNAGSSKAAADVQTIIDNLKNGKYPVK